MVWDFMFPTSSRSRRRNIRKEKAASTGTYLILYCQIFVENRIWATLCNCAGPGITKTNFNDRHNALQLNRKKNSESGQVPTATGHCLFEREVRRGRTGSPTRDEYRKKEVQGGRG